jgi:epoxyqueuosine reductase QueG
MGADLVGIADLKLLRDVETVPKDLLDGFNYAISIAVKLPTAVFEQLEDAPTPLYAQVYNNANLLLDQIALKLSSHLEGQGYCALPIPASLPLDMERFTSNLSAKAVANAAGLGWQGKSLLIVTPEHGPRVRFATILTDMPLTPDRPVENRCGTCCHCTDACPASAIRNVNTEFHYSSREEALDFQKCADKLVKEFMLLPRVEKPICGICIKVCPWGRKQKNRKNASTMD